MTRRSLIVLSMGLTLAATACHKNPPPAVQPGAINPPPAPPPPPPSDRNSGNVPPPPPMNGGSDTGLDSKAASRVATIGEKIHFDYNEAEIRPDDTKRLDAKAVLLKQFPSVRIRVTGHADERGSDQYNIALGLRRAAAAKAYLVQLGIDQSRIDVASLGREVPVDPGHDESAWAQNRRDEFEIIAGTQSLRVP